MHTFNIEENLLQMNATSSNAKQQLIVDHSILW